MSDFLYEKFLEDRRVYHVARAFWFRQVKQLLPNQESSAPYLSERFENGKLFYDGNPMFNTINRRTSKAARIVQESPLEFETFYTSWEQEISLQLDLNGREVSVHEKVIVLTLTRESLEKSKEELRRPVNSNVEWASVIRIPRTSAPGKSE
jgi:hypothetical protein